MKVFYSKIFFHLTLTNDLENPFLCATEAEGTAKKNENKENEKENFLLTNINRDFLQCILQRSADPECNIIPIERDVSSLNTVKLE